MMRYWDVSERPVERLAEDQRPADLGAVEPLLGMYADAPRRFCNDDGTADCHIADEVLRTFRPARAWTYRTRRWSEYDGADLEADFAYQDGARLRCYRGAKGQDHRFPPLVGQEAGTAFTLLLDPTGAEHLPLEILGLHVRLRYDELARAARLATDPAERARWVYDMLEVLHVVRTDEPARISRAFARNHDEFSDRGNDPFYVVSDLYALVRLGKDPWPFLDETAAHFADRERILQLAGESRCLPPA